MDHIHVGPKLPVVLSVLIPAKFRVQVMCRLNSKEFEITLLNFSEALARLISFQNSSKFTPFAMIYMHA
jgi:hypothetical protein